jgi:hypothetical protein
LTVLTKDQQNSAKNSTKAAANLEQLQPHHLSASFSSSFVGTATVRPMTTTWRSGRIGKPLFFNQSLPEHLFFRNKV